MHESVFASISSRRMSKALTTASSSIGKVLNSSSIRSADRASCCSPGFHWVSDASCFIRSHILYGIPGTTLDRTVATKYGDGFDYMHVYPIRNTDMTKLITEEADLVANAGLFYPEV